jgi:hypothetical protein
MTLHGCLRSADYGYVKPLEDAAAYSLDLLLSVMTIADVARSKPTIATFTSC